jgi:hypothetical protein
MCRLFCLALICSVGALTAVSLAQVHATQPAGAKAPAREPRYVVYWLTKTESKSEYRMLLITRTPLAELATELTGGFKGHAPPQLLEQPALTIATYKKDSIWNDGVPLKAVTRFRDLNDKKRTLEVNGVPYQYEEGTLADVVRLLKAPEGTEKISRLFPPLSGMENTAHALRLLLGEQMKHDETKKK